MYYKTCSIHVLNEVHQNVCIHIALLISFGCLIGYKILFPAEVVLCSQSYVAHQNTREVVPCVAEEFGLVFRFGIDWAV